MDDPACSAHPSRGVFSATGLDELERRRGVSKVCWYDANKLATWAALADTASSIWTSAPFWRMLFQLAIVSLLTAVLSAAAIIDPAHMHPDKFDNICTFLNYFLALLLAFFMSMSVRRWYECASGFLKLADAIRTMQMQLLSLGVDEQKHALFTRYGALSARLLDLHLRAEAAAAPEKKTNRYIMNKVWSEIDRRNTDTPRYVNKIERQMLMKSDDPAAFVWKWIASLVGRMAQDGDIPPMQSPTFARIMMLVQAATKGIREVRTSTMVQVPYVYVQMLATLLHVNNILNAISFGLTSGVALAAMISRHATRIRNVVQMETLILDLQEVVICFFTRAFGPCIYIALFQMCIYISNPFASPEGNIHTDAFCQNLEKDLQDARFVGAHPPAWELPRYKQK